MGYVGLHMQDFEQGLEVGIWNCAEAKKEQAWEGIKGQSQEQIQKE